jgi:hypothetical protein
MTSYSRDAAPASARKNGVLQIVESPSLLERARSSPIEPIDREVRHDETDCTGADENKPSGPQRRREKRLETAPIEAHRNT